MCAFLEKMHDCIGGTPCVEILFKNGLVVRLQKRLGTPELSI